MWPFTKPLDAIAEEDLQALVAAGAREGIGLEFKQQMYERRDPAQTRELLRDVSSMANAEGGVLILGMEEDGEGAARRLAPVPDAEAEAHRLLQLCLAHLAERVPGLRAARIPIAKGDVIVVHIPRSYRRPHMITLDGLTEFWIRHDRQKSRMSIGEIPTAVTATQDLEMKLEQFIKERQAILRALTKERGFVLMATPLVLEDGRVDIMDEQLEKLLLAPPSYRGRGGVPLSSNTASIHPFLHGVRARA